MAGIVTTLDGARVEPARVRVMSDAIVHRGPDAHGAWHRDHVALGHQRLSILDLSDAADQPMHGADGRFTIVFNGEIYNFVELRAELARLGAQFRTQSDTEVILEAYRVWGRECVTRFNGMWAFAIWDSREHELYLSRDRLGIKPLYILKSGDLLAFASEVKALLAAFPDERVVNERIVKRHVLGLPTHGTRETFFARIESFPAAHDAVYSARTGAFATRRYWRIEPAQSGTKRSAEDAIVQLRELLESSVALHMRSDVAVGTCLSGGLDSSTVVAAMSRMEARPVHTYSGLYTERGFDEQRWVDQVNAHCRTVPAAVRPAPHGDLIDDLDTLTWHQDAPSGGPGLYTQFHVMKRAARDVKVILDGQGGDELFAGYIPYFRPHLADLWSGGPVGRVKAGVLAAEVLQRWGYEHRRGIFAWVAGERVARRVVPARRLPPLIESAFSARAGDGGDAWRTPRTMATRLDDALYWDTVLRVLPDLLHYEDRNAMAFSVEARVPLLDHRIVELAFSLASDLKLHGSWTKWPLRKAVETWLPHDVVWRRTKLGYPTPFGAWLRTEPDRSAAAQVLFSRELLGRGVVRTDALRAMWDQHQAGSADHAWPLWRILTLELWYRQFIDAWRPRPAPRLDANGRFPLR